MPDEIQEAVTESIEEIALDDVIERESPEGRGRRGWEVKVAFSSSLLAVLSAVAALLATFASDDAARAMSSETDVAAYAEGVAASHLVLGNRIAILQAIGTAPSEGDLAELARIEVRRREYRLRATELEAEGDRAFRVHDHLAIAVTLFQVTMLLGGLSVMVEKVALWRFGLLFSGVGLGFFLWGVIGYVR